MVNTIPPTHPTLAFVIDELEVGGSQRQLHLIATGLARRGWQVQVICLQPILAMAPDFTEAGIPVQVMQKHSKLDVRLVAGLRRFFLTHGVGMVHAMSSTAEFFAGLAARCCGIPFVASIRDAHLPLPFSHRMGKRLSCVLAHAVVANSQEGARAAVADRLVAADKVRVIANGMRWHPPAISREEMRRRLGLPLTTPVVLSVGRLVWRKRYELTLAIARRTETWQPAPHFLIVGGGPLHDALAEQIQAHGLGERVHLLGERRDVSALLAASDVYLSTSIFEGLSNSIMEAMIAAVPVLAAADGGTPELIHDGETGLLFPAGDLTDAFIKFERLVRDPALRARLGCQARQRIETVFNYDAMISQYEGLYGGVLAAGARPAAVTAENEL
jgi:glycosyltransferase involved in cell wall biosynthesis